MEQEPKELSQEALEGKANEVLRALEGLKAAYYDRVSPELQEDWYYAALALDAAEDLASWISEGERVLALAQEEIKKLEG